MKSHTSKAQGPNLFQFATRELSQDAFFCWIISWADPQFADINPQLHKVARCFVNILLTEHYFGLKSGAKILVRKQYKNIDILVEIDSDIILLIEDKTHSKEHSEQLERYSRIVEQDFPGRRIAKIYLKTGDQSNYSSVEKAGFRRFGRAKILDFLSLACQDCDHPLLYDFFQFIEQIDYSVRSFRVVSPDNWLGRSPWIGLYIGLQERFIDLDWGYVSNPSGGFEAASWNWKTWLNPGTGFTHEVCLQIEQGSLCYKIAADRIEDRIVARDAWRSKLIESAELSNRVLRPPRRIATGTWMTVARLERADWLMLDNAGLIDMDATVACLIDATGLMDEAIA